jgi:hypothetical protein
VADSSDRCDRGRDHARGRGLAGECIGQHLFAEHVADGDEEVLDLDRFGAPDGAVGAIELVDEVLGHAFDVGPDFFHLRGALFGSRHPWLLSELGTKE